MIRLLFAILLSAYSCLASQGMGPGPGGISYTGFQDTFTDADGKSLTSHDSNWAAISGVSIAYAQILSNQVWNSSSSSGTGARYSASNADVSQIIIKSQSDTSVSVSKYVTVRSSATSKGYDGSLTTLNSGIYSGINVNKNGSYLGACSGKSISAGADHVLKITASGTSTVTVTVYVDGVSQCVKTDSSSTISNGNPGWYMGSSSVSGNRYLDNWSDH